MAPEDTGSEFSHDIHTKVRGKAAIDLLRRILGQPDHTEEMFKRLTERLTILEQAIGKLLEIREGDFSEPTMKTLDCRLATLEKGMAERLERVDDAATPTADEKNGAGQEASLNGYGKSWHAGDGEAEVNGGPARTTVAGEVEGQKNGPDPNMLGKAAPKNKWFGGWTLHF